MNKCIQNVKKWGGSIPKIGIKTGVGEEWDLMVIWRMSDWCWIYIVAIGREKARVNVVTLSEQKK